MAYLRRLPKSPFWIAGFTLPDGRRTQRSTKMTDRKKALKLALQWEEAANNRITEAQARRVLSDIHEQIHGTQLSTPTVSEYAAQWLGRKEGETKQITLSSSGCRSSRFRSHGPFSQSCPKNSRRRKRGSTTSAPRFFPRIRAQGKMSTRRDFS